MLPKPRPRALQAVYVAERAMHGTPGRCSLHAAARREYSGRNRAHPAGSCIAQCASSIATRRSPRRSAAQESSAARRSKLSTEDLVPAREPRDEPSAVDRPPGHHA